MSDLLTKLEAIHFRFIEVGNLITDPDIIADMKRYVKLNKEYKDLQLIVDALNKYKNILGNIENSKEVIETETDREFVDMAKQEFDELLPEKEKMEEEIKVGEGDTVDVGTVLLIIEKQWQAPLLSLILK